MNANQERALELSTSRGRERCDGKIASITPPQTLHCRCHALAGVGGDDDYFSSDLTDAELGDKFAALAGLPTLLLLSEADEYVPSAIDYLGLGRRLQRAAGPAAQLVVVEGGCHSLAGAEEQAAQEIAAFLQTL